MTKISQSTPNLYGGFNKLPQRIGWAGCKSVKLVEKNYQIVTEYPLKSKESNKKNDAQFWDRMREKWLKLSSYDHLKDD